MAEPPGDTPDSRPGQADPDPSCGLVQRPKYSPLVRRLAEEFAVDLSTLIGTGPSGRITRHDVQAAAMARESGSAGDRDAPTDERYGPAPTDEPPTPVEVDDSDTDTDTGERANGAPPPQPGVSGSTFVVTSSVDGTQLARSQERLGSHAGRAIALDALLLRLVSAALVDFPELQLSTDPRAVGFIRPSEDGVVADVVPEVAGSDVTAIDLAIANRVRSHLFGDEPIVAPVMVLDGGALGVNTMTAALEPGCRAVLAFGRFEPMNRGGGSRLTITATFAQGAIDLGRAAGFLDRVTRFVEDPILAFAG